MKKPMKAIMLLWVSTQILDYYLKFITVPRRLNHFIYIFWKLVSPNKHLFNIWPRRTFKKPCLSWNEIWDYSNLREESKPFWVSQHLSTADKTKQKIKMTEEMIFYFKKKPASE